MPSPTQTVVMLESARRMDHDQPQQQLQDVEEEEEDDLGVSNHTTGADSSHQGSAITTGTSGGGMSQRSTTAGAVEEDDYATATTTDAIARRENKAISTAKLIVLGFLISLAIIVSYVWYQFSIETQQEQYTTEFNEFSTKLLETFYQRLEYKVITSISLATTLSSSSSSSSGTPTTTAQQQLQQEWPYVSFTNWERRTAGVRRLTQASSIWFAPIVPSKDRTSWEAYAVSHQFSLNPNFTDPFTPPRYDGGGSSSRDQEEQTSSPYYHPLATSNTDQEEEEGGQQPQWTLEKGIYQLENGKPIPSPEYGGSGSSSSSSSINVSDEYDYYHAPIWQSAPHIISQDIAMFDQRSEYGRQHAIESLVTFQVPLLAHTQHKGETDSLVIQEESSSSSLSYPSSSSLYAVEPHVALYTPIFDKITTTTTNGDDNSSPPPPRRTVVGALTLEMSWNSFWSQSMTGIVAPLTVIVENTCDQSSYIFQVDSNTAEFIGEEQEQEKQQQDDDDEDDNTNIIIFDNSLDLILESDDRKLATIFGWNNDIIQNVIQNENENEEEEMSTQKNICTYRIKIIPTKAFEEHFLTNQPLLSALGVGAIFILTAAVFIFYDCLVERRQARVMLSAKRSNAIVRSLFPAGIRDRLIDDGKGRRNKASIADMLPENYLPLETPKLRLKNYLTDVPAMHSQKNSTNPSSLLGTEPIADFFPNTSVLFGDISGFSAWSSTREPSQVFALLETLYGAMDKAARKMHVFKVETVGDCYVAATGIPDPRDDHAVLMVRFAHTCLVRINQLTKALEAVLGPGTGELTMKIGIHSGPITAGVLRGEKSRFQLFGDTMNTAARMESTGKANKVHLSKETAELIIRAGKAKWVEQRSEVVTAKGKGELQTYWFMPSGMKSGRDSIVSLGPTVEASEQFSVDGTNAITSKDGSTNGVASPVTPKRVDWGDNGLEMLQERLDRLCDWNVEVIASLITNVIARRDAVKFDLVETDKSLRSGGIALDEMKEVVEFPSFSAEAAVKMAADSASELPPMVRLELRAYVQRIAASYRDNPFHNFEHASHVALSSNKLLKRIVMPDGVDYRRDSKQKEIEKIKAIASDLHEVTYGISSDPVTQLAVVFSALIHDAGHSGVPNGQLAKEEPETAAKYRNKSIAEQRSVDLAWNMLMEPGYENLRNCMFPSKYELNHFRQLIVNMVLATDIFDKELSALRKARWQKAFHPEDEIAPLDASQSPVHRKATIVIEHIIQASDVAHTMQHWQVYIKWNEKLFHEMYKAYKDERAEKDPLEGWYKGELWFFDNYVIPLAHKLKECGVFGVSSAEYLNYAIENRDEWARKGMEVCQQMVANFEASRFA